MSAVFIKSIDQPHFHEALSPNCFFTSELKWCEELTDLGVSVLSASVDNSLRYLHNSLHSTHTHSIIAKELSSATLKIKKICLSPKLLIPPCRPYSDSAPFGAIWSQFMPKQLNQEAIPSHTGAHFSLWVQINPRQLDCIGVYWPWFKGAKLDSKIGL